MSNLAQSQANWNAIGREAGLYLGAVKALRDLSWKFSLKFSRIQVLEVNNVNSSTSLWTLAGVVIGTNTSELGNLWVRIQKDTPGAGQATVSLYTAAGASGLVAQGVVTYPGVCTLAAQNASGLTGTVTIANISAGETTDAHQLLVFPDFPVRARAVFDGTKVEHPDLTKNFEIATEAVSSAIEGAITTMEGAFIEWIQTRLTNFLGSGQSSPINKTDSNDQGAVTTLFEGVLEDWRKDMVDELTAGAQKVVKNVVAAATPAYDSQNQGLGSLTTPTLNEWAEQGTITLTCDDATIGAEKFLVVQRRTLLQDTIQAQEHLQIGRAYADTTLGIVSALLTRTLTLATGLTADFGAMASWATTGESSTNTAGGVLYAKIVDGGGGLFGIELYKDSTYLLASRVCTSTVGAANAVLTLSQSNGSGLTGSAKLGSGPTIGNTGSVNLNPFRKQNANGVPDKITIAVTVTSKGEFQDYLGKLMGYTLNSGASGTETLNEGYVKAGTFPPYSVRSA